MKNIILNNKVEIPEIGFGVYGLTPGKTTVNAVRCALNCGYRHIDAAKIYRNERSVSSGIKQSLLPRDQIFVTTKMWTSDIKNHNGEKAFYTSLKKLGLDYIDLYLLHWPVEGYIDAYLTMEKLYQEGKIRAIGVSNFQIRHLENLMKYCHIKPAVNQIEVNPWFSNKELIAYCHQHDIAVEAWSPLGGVKHLAINNETILKLSEKYHVSPSNIIIKWHLQNNLIVLVRSKNPVHIKQNIDLGDFTLSEDDMKLIDSLNINVRTGGDPDRYQ